MIDSFAEVGVGGAVALLVLKEVFTFVKTTRGNGKDAASGAKPVEFWQAEIRHGVSESVRTELAPLLTVQTELLKEIRSAEGDIAKGVSELVVLARRGDS